MKTALFLIIITLSHFAASAWAAESSTPHDRSQMMNMNPSKEDRSKMASAHAQMATCLSSDQDFMQCHDALHKECQSMMGGSCPGMAMENSMHKELKTKK